LVAADLATLATLAAQGPLQALDKAYQQPGQTVKVSVRHVAEHHQAACHGRDARRAVAQSSTVDQMIQGWAGDAATRATIGKIGVGVAVSRGGRRPDISSVDR
jgi:hypothetical protein